MRSFRFLLLSAFVIFLLGSHATGALAQEYLLGEGDLLKITVYENPDLTTQTRVSGDGLISVPLVGTVKVSGLTIAETEKTLIELFSDGFIVNPQVSVFVAEYRSKKVTILGEVNKPGLYELAGNVSLLEIISKAEGITQSAGETIVVKRKTPSGPDPAVSDFITVNLKDLMEKGDPAANIIVQDGDSIFVSQSGFVYVTGEVNKPGMYKYEQGMTVMKAIALAGGFTDKAAQKRVELIRLVGSEEEKQRVVLSQTIMPQDVISVPESFF